MGKFARLAVGTRHIDYNGRLCMVAAGAANLKAFGIDRAANPVGRHRRDRPASWCSARTCRSAARSPPTTSGARATAARA